MASLKNMEMATAVIANTNIEIKKSLFGLKTQAVYAPTGSALNCYRYEYAPEAEGQLQRLLSAKSEQVADEAKAVSALKQVDMGNVRLEAAVSQDHQFAALQILKFTNFNYAPVSDVKFFEGDEAKAVAGLFA